MGLVRPSWGRFSNFKTRLRREETHAIRAADNVLIFLIFGAVLERTGAGESLIRISTALTARIGGGAAHAAIGVTFNEIMPDAYGDNQANEAATRTHGAIGEAMVYKPRE